MKQSVSRRFSLAIIGVVAVIVIGFTVVLVWDNVKLLKTALHQRLSLAADLADLPGARVVAPAGVFTGTDPAVFAFQRVTTERNIYRVPVPK